MNIIKRYIFWTYERGSFHYDVMVTVILLFIFISPHIIDFGDRPVLLYQVSVNELKAMDTSAGTMTLQQQLASSIQPIAGEVVIDRFKPLRNAGGTVVAYQVFAHHPAGYRVQ